MVKFILVFMLFTDKGPDFRHVGEFDDLRACQAAAGFALHAYEAKSGKKVGDAGFMLCLQSKAPEPEPEGLSL